MEAFELAQLIDAQAGGAKPYLEFLRVPALSVGLYVLPADGVDGQQPHSEDEIYYVVRGAGAIRVGDEDRPVGPGSVIYIPAQVPHHFHSIAEALTILVFFAPAEYTRTER